MNPWSPAALGTILALQIVIVMHEHEFEKKVLHRLDRLIELILEALGKKPAESIGQRQIK